MSADLTTRVLAPPTTSLAPVFILRDGSVAAVRAGGPADHDTVREFFRQLSPDIGGFLGMGDQYVVVRPSAISFNAKDNKWQATMNVNAEQLRAAPEYKYSSKS